jgi:NAD(P)-dependent dehydrogenase (short-subunit alcohol dehydrogenase family)
MTVRSSSLAGKVAIVTGASRGIGRAIALRLAADGAVIAANGRDTSLLNGMVTEITRTGGQAQAFAYDLLETNAPGALIDAVQARFSGIDILVNSAGATKRGDFLQQPDTDWIDGFCLKFFAAVRLTRLAWPQLRAARGAVLTIAGIGARTPIADFAVGASVNAALLAFTKAMAARGVADGVRVNAINPGAVRTDRFRRRLDAIIAAGGVSAVTAEARFVAASAITRVGEPADVANLAAFILSEQGAWLQGALLDIDGGETKSL